MKRFFISLAFISISATTALAQFDEVKNMLMIQQYGKAKGLLDQAMAKPKNAVKPEGTLIKAVILAGMMNDSINAGKVTELRTESMQAYRKYLELDPAKSLIADPVYVGAPITYYSSYFNEGIKGFNKKDWPAASQAFTNTVEWSDFIINNKLAKMEFDTSAVLLAGAAYQNLKTNDEEAAKYFRRLAEKNVAGEDNEFVYQFLVQHAFKAEDMASFEKYKDQGKRLYPKSEFFTYSEMDFIMSMEEEGEKMKRIEAKIAKEPENLELIENYGLILFETLNNDESAAKVADKGAIEQKMIQFLSRAGDAKPNDGKAYFYLGNHFVNKAVKINQDITAVTDAIKKANATAKPDKTGKITPPKDLVDKRDGLRKLYNDEIEKALPYMVKSAEGYGRHGALTGMEKQNYKRLADQLSLIYGDKKISAKTPADKAKWEAEEKKWNAVYSSLSK